MKISESITNKSSITAFKSLEDKFNTRNNFMFDYSMSIYKNTTTEIEVYCKEHKNIFWIKPNSHLKGIGCEKCTSKNRSKAVLKKIEDIRNYNIEDNIIKDSIEYIGTKLQARCKIHGLFNTNKDSLKCGKACKGCHKDKRIFNGKDTNWFIAKSKSEFDNFSYKFTHYKSSSEYLTITCNIHGNFEVRPNNHYKSNYGGCKKCKSNGRYSNNIKLYYVKLYRGEEVFYKIGITKNKVVDRFRKQARDNFKIEIIFEEFFVNGREALYKEQLILNSFDEFRNNDKKVFNYDGFTEVFTSDILDR